MRCCPIHLLAALLTVFSTLLPPVTAAHAQQAQPEFKSSSPAEAIVTLTAALAGRWKTREKYERLELLATPALESEGEYVWRPGPAGLTLLEEYRARTPIGELIGFGVVWWDQARQLQSLWCANIDPSGCVMFPRPPFRPTWDGKQFVLDNEVDIAGRTYAWHEVITITSPTTFTVTIDIGESRDRMKRWLTSQATKIGA